jgi:hypothetical protein
VRANRPDYRDLDTSHNSESVARACDVGRDAAALRALARLLGRQAARDWLSFSYTVEDKDAGASHG